MLLSFPGPHLLITCEIKRQVERQKGIEKEEGMKEKKEIFQHSEFVGEVFTRQNLKADKIHTHTI